MVGHQRPCVIKASGFEECFSKTLHEVIPVRVVLEDLFLLNDPDNDVMESTW